MTPRRIPESEMQESLVALAGAGVPLFVDAPARGSPLERDAYRDLLRELLVSGDVHLLVAIPCLLAANDGAASSMAIREVAEGVDETDRARLGLLVRLARALCVSRGPDLRHLLGHTPRLDPVSFEPSQLPDPGEDCGEACVREAADREEDARQPAVAADAERAFDTWIGILSARRGSLESA